MRLYFRGIQRLLQARLRLYTDETLDDFAVLEQHERRDATHTVVLRGPRSVINVKLANFDRAGIFAGELLDDGRDLTTGSTPRGPKVDQHGLARLQNFTVKIVV